jgi:multisubunit Na+/H+ antiporter MnhB subunit
VVFSLYLLFAGHNAPGGGFVGGLVAGAALVLQYAGHGADSVRALLRVRHEVLLGAGLLLAGLTGLSPMLSGGQFLQSAYVELHLPLLGSVSLVSVLAFDIGVYLVVVGLVLAVLRTLGAEGEEA